MSLGGIVAAMLGNPAPPWMDHQQLGSIHQSEAVRNMCRQTIEAGIYYQKRAAAVKAPISQLMGPSTGAFRIGYGCYLVEASRYRVLEAYSRRFGGEVPEAIDETKMDEARAWWSRRVDSWEPLRFRYWGDPDTLLMKKIREAEAWLW